MTDHSSKQYDIELETLRSRVLEMGGLVEAQIRAAIDGLTSGDVPALDAVIADDHRVNALEVSIDTESSHLIARRQPAASDLIEASDAARCLGDRRGADQMTQSHGRPLLQNACRQISRRDPHFSRSIRYLALCCSCQFATGGRADEHSCHRSRPSGGSPRGN